MQTRRRAALARLSVTEAELRARAKVYRLNATELAVLDELDDLDFLLGADDE